MRRKSLWAASVISAILVTVFWKGTWPTAAGEKAAAPPTAVGLLDLAKIFNSHTRFKKLSDALRKDVEAAELQLKTSKAELQADADFLATLLKGSPAAIEKELEITKKSADLQLQVAQQKKAFFEQEAAIYWKVYQEVMKEVERLADARGITLVMRFNGEPFNANDPQAIQKELNKAILYHKGIDVTDEILRIVNAQPDA